jgi:hypothetical protein
MQASETAARLAGFGDRTPGSDAERRAAGWLADELAASGREVRVETFWCRPNWALAQSWHVTLALAGSLVSVGSPRVGIVLLVVALLAIVADAFTGISPGRRLTPERASQNVVAPAPQGGGQSATRLILTANYDAGRTGLAYRNPLRHLATRLRGASGPLSLGWLGWLAVAVVWLLAVAALRASGNRGTVVGVAQLIPSVGLVLALALLFDLAGAGPSPAANDNASGTALAMSLVRALDAAPPLNLAVELVLTGAGEGSGLGLRRYLRGRRRELRPANAIVIGFAASGVGTPRWWTSDGALLPLRYSRPLTSLCAAVADEELHLDATPYRGRGSGPAFPARLARLPATTIGSRDGRGRVPHSHQPSDRAEVLDAAALDDATQFSLMLVDALDAYLASRRSAGSPAPA